MFPYFCFSSKRIFELSQFHCCIESLATTWFVFLVLVILFPAFLLDFRFPIRVLETFFDSRQIKTLLFPQNSANICTKASMLLVHVCVGALQKPVYNFLSGHKIFAHLLFGLTSNVRECSRLSLFFPVMVKIWSLFLNIGASHFYTTKFHFFTTFFLFFKFLSCLILQDRKLLQFQ